MRSAASPTRPTRRAVQPGLADARVQHRRLGPRVGADQQDPPRRVDVGDRARSRHSPSGCPPAASRRRSGTRRCRRGPRPAPSARTPPRPDARSPTSPATSAPFAAAATAAKASAQVAGRSRPPSRMYGRSSRCRRSPSQMNRDRSASHSSFTPSWLRGRIRITSRPLASTRMLRPERVHHVDRLGLGQLPRPRRERIGLRGQRPDRAEVDDVALQLARQHRARDSW